MSTLRRTGWLGEARRILANISAEQPCRTSSVACRVCTAPVDGYPRCINCNRNRNEAEDPSELADLVVPLAYAWEGQSQLGKDVYSYKRDKGRRAARAIANLAALVYSFQAVHAECPGRYLGHPVSAKAVMPSLRGNSGVTLVQMAQNFLPQTWPLITISATGVYGDAGRSLDPAHFRVDRPASVRGKHVLVLDDTWVTGAHAQSLAIALRRAGAARITVLPICRLLSPTWNANVNYRDSKHRRLWSADTCPVTGDVCP